MAHKVKALQQWCKLRCDGYRDVEITNMTSSWKSGLAFCAIIHRYRPDLIDYDSLKKEDTYGNSKMAFDVALKELGIAALLDPEDMVVMTVPDKLCIVTYVAQYYNYFHDKPQLGGPGVKSAVKRPLQISDICTLPELKKLTPAKNTITATHVEKKISPAAKRRTIEDRCCMCQEKVYLLERHYSGGKLYHRHCCREAERSSTLKRNKNLDASREKTESSHLKGNLLPKTATSKADDIFGNRTTSNVKEISSKQLPEPSGLIKSFVPQKYKSEVSEPNHDLARNSASKFLSPHCEPKNENISLHSKSIQSKMNSVMTNNAVPGIVSVTTSTMQVNSSTASSITTCVRSAPTISTYACTSNIDASIPNTNKYSAPLMKNSSGAKTTSIFTNPVMSNANGSDIFQSTNKNSANIAIPAASFDVSNGLTTAQSYSGPTSSFSPAITSNAKTTRYVSILQTRTTDTVASTTSAVTIVTSVSDLFPASRIELRNTKASIEVPSSVSASKGSFLDSKGSSLLSAGQKKLEVKTVGVRDDDANKPEWQLEAERRQAARNGVYLDPEKHPRNATAQKFVDKFIPVDQLQKENNVASKDGGTKVDTILKHNDSQQNAKETLTKILKKQLNPNKESDGIKTANDASLSQLPVQDLKMLVKGGNQEKDSDWVIIEHPSSENTRQEMLISPSFRIAKHELPTEETATLSPPERFKLLVGEGNFGFSNKDRVAEIVRPSFQHNPSPYPQEMRKKAKNPLIPKRKVNAEEKVSVDKINKKLISLDEQLRAVETKGRELEDKIRGGTDEAMDEDEDELMIHWFSLVKQKYELVREESDLMYRRRQQELEELHEELEYQYRCLISKPDEHKTADEKNYEEDLLKEILETVRLRDSIIDSIEIDRQRYLEEDKKIDNMMVATGVNASGKVRKMKKNKKKAHVVGQKEGIQRRISFWKRS